ncbi:MAG: 2-hydroxyacyl-CoA dehydratase [Dehalococcoidia bacterium]|nr:2-hydroxyacyl-CoA dehydratase [Dehalococcoidia bacterium]
MPVNDRFETMVSQRHQYAREWKERTGGKVVGYMCTYIPEEVLYAAGMLPVRLLGEHRPESVTEAHMPGFFCSYTRGCLAEGLLGRYDYLDGIIAPHGCYQIRQAYAIWNRHASTDYKFYFFMPTVVRSSRAHQALVTETQRLRTSLQDWLGRPVTDEALRKAVDVYNANRSLLTRLYDLRKDDHSVIPGSQVLKIVLASQLMDKAEHTEALQGVLNSLSPGPVGEGVRLIVVGSEMDDPAMLELVESLGGDIVVDEHCAGSRYFWGQVGNGNDVVAAIARRYVDRPACPLYDQPDRRRTDHVLALARDYGVQGALLVHLKFCDPHEYDMPHLRTSLQKRGIPSLDLETDLTIPVGQFHTRIEAFMETIIPEG